MLDIGFTKLLLIAGIALVVVGPERLPRVARTLGTLLGRAQRYMSDVKAEVNRSMELEELRRMQGEFQRAAQDIHSSVNSGLQEAGDAVNQAWSGASSGATPAADGGPIHHRPKKVNWRLKRSATPVWFKQRQRVRTRALSGAARVARYRPKSLRGPR